MVWWCGWVKFRAFTFNHTHFCTCSSCGYPELVWKYLKCNESQYIVLSKKKDVHLLWVVRVLCRIGARGVCFIFASIHHVICVHNSLTWAVQQYWISMFWLRAKKKKVPCMVTTPALENKSQAYLCLGCFYKINLLEIWPWKGCLVDALRPAAFMKAQLRSLSLTTYYVY